jgi:hypothetical protein
MNDKMIILWVGRLQGHALGICGDKFALYKRDREEFTRIEQGKVKWEGDVPSAQTTLGLLRPTYWPLNESNFDTVYIRPRWYVRLWRWIKGLIK